MTPEVVIPISFRPLLAQACAYLGFPCPTYHCWDLATNNYLVIVELACTPNAYKIYGGPGETVEDSCEEAAKKMLVHLMNTHGLCVDDVNLEKTDRLDRCLAFFMLKRKNYEDMEKGCASSGMGSIIPSEHIHPDRRGVKVDFSILLNTVVQKFNLHVTPIDYFQVGMYDHVAWLLISQHGKLCEDEVIISDQHAIAEEAKQPIAKKAILFLMPIYNFVIEDANFHFLQQSTLSSKLVREAYLTVKERIYDSVENREPQPFVIEEAPATPRGPGFRIPEGPPPQIPPKKGWSLDLLVTRFVLPCPPVSPSRSIEVLSGLGWSSCLHTCSAQYKYFLRTSFRIKNISMLKSGLFL